MNRLYARKDAPGKLGASLIAVIGLYLLLAPSMARAEAVEDESGFHLGLKLAAASLHADETAPEFRIEEEGGGVQLDIGYRFNPVFMLEMVLGGSNHETSDSTIDARTEFVQLFAYYRFSPERSLRPYIKGGFAGHALVLESESVEARIRGGGLAFGGGFRYFLSPRFSIGLDLTHNIIKYDEAELSVGQFSYEFDIDEHGESTTLGLMFGYSF